MGLMAQAEAQFRAAIALAQAQETRLFELRATSSLSRLLTEQRRREKAYDMLEAVDARFTEGFETKDLREAAQLLSELRDSNSLIPNMPINDSVAVD